jgi:microcin C transport system permease protein
VEPARRAPQDVLPAERRDEAARQEAKGQTGARRADLVPDSVPPGLPAPLPGAAVPSPRFLGMRVSPLTRRRIDSFKRNRRGYMSLWLLSVLFGTSLCAELIANDQPILVSYEGKLYFPLLTAYPETTFGGDFETEAEYLEPLVAERIAAGGGFMLWPPVRFDYATVDLHLPATAPAPPSAWHWLGTDDAGRDLFARLLYGFRLSLLFGLALTTLSTLIGVVAGAVQGYFGGWVDLLMQRGIEVFSGLPVLFLLIILASIVEPSFGWLLGILLLFSWLALVGVVRAEFLRARKLDYVRAARAMGTSNVTIMRRHMLPNAAVATMTFLPFILAGSVTTLTALDFLGLGLPIGAASLGEILQQGRANLWAPWIGISAFLVLGVMLTLIIFVSEAVRDAFDPRKR